MGAFAQGEAWLKTAVEECFSYDQNHTRCESTDQQWIYKQRRADMETINLTVSGMTCGSCVKHVEKAIHSIEGVEKVAVDLDSGLVKVDGSSSQSIQAIIAALDEAGYPAQVTSDPVNQTKVQRRSCKSVSSCCCN